MFSLIVSVVSLALAVASLSAVSYHGGDVLTKGKTQAQIAEATADIEHMQLAVNMYQMTNGGLPDKVATLVPTYLSSLPKSFVTPATASFTAIAASQLPGLTVADKQSMCDAVNVKLGLQFTTPLCSSISNSFAGCCTDVGAAATASAGGGSSSGSGSTGNATPASNSVKTIASIIGASEVPTAMCRDVGSAWQNIVSCDVACSHVDHGVGPYHITGTDGAGHFVCAPVDTSSGMPPTTVWPISALSCASGYTLNATSTSCDANPTCPSGYTLSADGQTCTSN